jgi:predicted metal-binding membrane protein
VSEPAARPSPIQRALSSERGLVAAALAGLTLLSWLYLLSLAADMRAMPAAACEAMGMGRATALSAREVGLELAMWSVMMVGMMLPSAAPTILLVTSLQRRALPRAAALRATGAFALGYVLVWCGFSVLATVAELGLQRAALLSPMGVSASPWLAGGLLVAAGLHQATPWKRRCLVQCRAPVGFVTRHWRPGAAGALRMGVVNGALCLGCCAALMALLFVGGVMNLLWIAALTAFVAVEKLAPQGARVARLAAPALVLAGVALWMRAELVAARAG